MTSPQALAGASMSGTLVGGVLQGIGANSADQSQAAASTYKAGVAQLNKQINLQNANWATESGQAQGMTQGMKSRQQIAQTKTVQAASGFDVNSGTGQKVRQDQTNVAQYDQNVISWDASKTAYGYETKATMDDAETNLDQMAAESEKTAGQFAMLGSFINAGTNVSSKWLQASQAGIF